MKATKLKKLLVKAIKNNKPVLIKGAPGIGKSDIVKQAAAEAGADLIITHPVVEDPTDKKGLPGIVDGQAEFLPYGDLRKMMEVDRLTVVLIDDLGQAPACVQASNMQLLLAREINGKKISDHVVFISATNRREDKAGVTGVLEPIKSRFKTIVQLDVDVDDWCAWALENGVAPEVVAFVRLRPGLMTDPGAPTNDIVNRPSPRTVTNLAEWVALGITDVETLGGAAGTGLATEFVGFLRVWEDLPDMDAVLSDPTNAVVPTEPAAMYAISTAIATMANEDNASSIIQYATRLPDEFGVLAIRDTLRKCPEAANNVDFIQWANDHQEILL